jgi:hypothetical protein
MLTLSIHPGAGRSGYPGRKRRRVCGRPFPPRRVVNGTLRIPSHPFRNNATAQGRLSAARDGHCSVQEAGTGCKHLHCRRLRRPRWGRNKHWAHCTDRPEVRIDTCPRIDWSNSHRWSSIAPQHRCRCIGLRGIGWSSKRRCCYSIGLSIGSCRSGCCCT